jgi:hypothetical protein
MEALWPEITVLPADPERCRPSLQWMPSVIAMNDAIVQRLRPYRTTPEVYPALRRGGLISFFRKQCASLPA